MKKLLMLSALLLAASQIDANPNCGVVDGPVIAGQTFTVPDKQCPPCPICPKTRCDVVQGSCIYQPARATQETYCEKKVCHVCHKHCGGACTRKHGHVVEEAVVEQRAARPAHNAAKAGVNRAGVRKAGNN